MIIFGSKMYFKGNVVNSFGECEHCGVYGKQTSYQAKKFGHLYFIPLIPLGPKSQILNECKSCSQGIHIPMQSIDPMIDALSRQFKSWVLEVEDGKTEITPEEGDEPVNVGVLIAGILEHFYCLKEIESVDAISEILTSNGMDYENAIVLGRWFEIMGDLEQAKFQYESAHRIQPEDPLPIFQSGSVSLQLGDPTEAESAFLKLTKLTPDDISVWARLADIYEAQKDFPKIIDAYDQLFSLHPELISNKAMKKTYKKACKKSALQGKFLNQL